MALKHRVAAVLQEPAVKRIHFQMGKLPVTSFQLKKVAAKIEKDEIHVYVYRQLKHAAEYVPRRDSILLKRDDILASVYGKSAVVHEAVHAMTDMNRATSTTLYSAEVAAYLAQMIYALAAGDEKFRFKALIMNPAGRIAREALRLIDDNKMLKETVNLKWRDYQDLREAIKAHPKYQEWEDKQLFPADGIKRKVKTQQSGGCSMASNAPARGAVMNRSLINREAETERQVIFGMNA
jgi:hypothetical protein